ncbi:MAG: hypothetical protein K9N34_08465 [Candidatus Marinimicrobia bacterium]|nr:hypothetical protein [Candidatus Neomarinimicrobiota bacterium]MCF7903050.1 hypothetical protein [Candidatus Neomarinimicrobiota bacterium]
MPHRFKNILNTNITFFTLVFLGLFLMQCGPKLPPETATAPQTISPQQQNIPSLPSGWVESRGNTRQEAWEKLVASVGQVYRGVSQLQNLVEESSLGELTEYTRSQAEGRTESVGYLENVKEYRDGSQVVLRVPQLELTRLGIAKSLNATYMGISEDPRVIQEIYTNLYFIDAPRRFEPILASRFWGGAKAFYLDDLKRFVFWNQGGNVDRIYTILQLLNQDQYSVTRTQDRIINFEGMAVPGDAFLLLRNAIMASEKSELLSLALLKAYRQTVLTNDLMRQNALNNEIERLSKQIATNVPYQVRQLRAVQSELSTYLAPLELAPGLAQQLAQLWQVPLQIKATPDRVDVFAGKITLRNLPQLNGRNLPLAIDNTTTHDKTVRYDHETGTLTNFSAIGKQYLRVYTDFSSFLATQGHTGYEYLNDLAPGQLIEYTTTVPLVSRGKNSFTMDLSTDDQDLIMRIINMSQVNQGYHYYFCNLITSGADRGKIEYLPFRNQQGLPLTEANWRNGYRVPKSDMQGHWDFIMLSSAKPLSIPNDHFIEPIADFSQRIDGESYTYATASIQVGN